jgi:hypothetical protein
MLPVIRPSPGHDIQTPGRWLGTVDVWRVPHDMRGGYGEIFRQLKERQRQLPS